MKQMIRAVTVVLLAGGWGLAGSAVYVVRTAHNVVVIPKDRLGFAHTYCDTRQWTLADDRSHADVVARMVQLGHADLLAPTVGGTPAEALAQLTAIAAQAPAADNAPPGSLAQQAEGQVKVVVDAAKRKLGGV